MTMKRLFGLTTFVNVIWMLSKSESIDPQPIQFLGDINMVFMLDLHTNAEDGTPCARLNLPAVQQLMASIWATEVLNSENAVNNIRFGLKIFDTCGSSDVAVRQAFRVVCTMTKENCSASNEVFLGVIGVGETKSLTSVSNVWSAFSIPFVIASPTNSDGILTSENVFLTSPDMMSQVKPLTVLLKTFQWNSIRLISSSDRVLNEFELLARPLNIALNQSLLVYNDHVDGKAVLQFLRNELNEQSVVVVMLSPEEILQLTTIVKEHPSSIKNIFWIIASPALDRTSLKDIGYILGPGLFLEPHVPKLAGFQSYFADKLMNRKDLFALEPILSQYLEWKYECTWKDSKNSTDYVRSCEHLLNSPQFQAAYHQDPGVSHVTEAVSALTAGYRIMTLDLCFGNSKCAEMEPLGKNMINALSKLGYSYRKHVQPEMEGAQFRLTDAGRLITIHSHIVFYNRSHDPALIGWYSDELGVNLGSFPESFARGRLDTTEFEHMTFEQDLANQSSATLNELLGEKKKNYNIHVIRVSHSALVRKPWAAATLALASVGILGTIYTLVYMVLRIYDGTLASGNQILGVTLLLSIVTMYVTCILFVFPQGRIICGIRLLLHPTVHMSCYAALLVKILGLRALEQLGLGGSVSYSNLVVTLLALIALQFAVVVTWMLVNGSGIGTDYYVLYCSVANETFMFLHVPMAVVLIVTCLYSFICRNIQRNNNESCWILLASVVCVAVWIGSAVLFHAAKPDFQEPIICAHQITIATAVLLSVFVPKLRTLSQQAAAFHHKKLPTSKSVTTVFQSASSNAQSLGDAILCRPIYDTYARKLHAAQEKRKEPPMVHCCNE